MLALGFSGRSPSFGSSCSNNAAGSPTTLEKWPRNSSTRIDPRAWDRVGAGYGPATLPRPGRGRSSPGRGGRSGPSLRATPLRSATGSPTLSTTRPPEHLRGPVRRAPRAASRTGLVLGLAQQPAVERDVGVGTITMTALFHPRRARARPEPCGERSRAPRPSARPRAALRPAAGRPRTRPREPREDLAQAGQGRGEDQTRFARR